eukprot:Rhum_TRINITY_DN14656_c23_g1::Rhum_TRINITY_DN14656_c23_g1_i1::g.108059::m.108059
MTNITLFTFSSLLPQRGATGGGREGGKSGGSLGAGVDGGKRSRVHGSYGDGHRHHGQRPVRRPDEGDGGGGGREGSGGLRERRGRRQPRRGRAVRRRVAAPVRRVERAVVRAEAGLVLLQRLAHAAQVELLLQQRALLLLDLAPVHVQLHVVVLQLLHQRLLLRHGARGLVLGGAAGRRALRGQLQLAVFHVTLRELARRVALAVAVHRRRLALALLAGRHVGLRDGDAVGGRLRVLLRLAEHDAGQVLGALRRRQLAAHAVDGGVVALDLLALLRDAALHLAQRLLRLLELGLVGGQAALHHLDLPRGLEDSDLLQTLCVLLLRLLRDPLPQLGPAPLRVVVARLEHGLCLPLAGLRVLCRRSLRRQLLLLRAGLGLCLHGLQAHLLLAVTQPVQSHLVLLDLLLLLAVRPEVLRPEVQSVEKSRVDVRKADPLLVRHKPILVRVRLLEERRNVRRALVNTETLEGGQERLLVDSACLLRVQLVVHTPLLLERRDRAPVLRRRQLLQTDGRRRRNRRRRSRHRRRHRRSRRCRRRRRNHRARRSGGVA